MKKSIIVFVFILSIILSVSIGTHLKLITISLINAEKNFSIKDFETNFKIKFILTNRKRIDMGHEFLIDVLKHNNRVDYYDLYLKLAKELGYKVTSYLDYIENYKDTEQKVLILRHDVDAVSEGCKKMFEVEKKNNVTATYYFRWKTFNKKLIDDLKKAGFEVGFHYETIANYCDKYKINTLTKYDIDKCRAILKEEIKNFKSQSGVNIKTIASHGATTNIMLKIPNKILFEGEDYLDYGIISETYDKVILEKYITTYICDTKVCHNFGFKYAANPIDAIMKNDKVIEFLSHPNHWDFTPAESMRMLKTITKAHSNKGRSNRILNSSCF